MGLGLSLMIPSFEGGTVSYVQSQSGLHCKALKKRCHSDDENHGEDRIAYGTLS